jgi:hypothetical protein
METYFGYCSSEKDSHELIAEVSGELLKSSSSDLTTPVLIELERPNQSETELKVEPKISLEQKLALVRNIPEFESFTNRDILELVRASRVESFKKDDVLIYLGISNSESQKSDEFSGLCIALDSSLELKINVESTGRRLNTGSYFRQTKVDNFGVVDVRAVSSGIVLVIDTLPICSLIDDPFAENLKRALLRISMNQVFCFRP